MSIEDHFPFEYDKATSVVGEDAKVFIQKPKNEVFEKHIGISTKGLCKRTHHIQIFSLTKKEK